MHIWALFSENPKGLRLCNEHSRMGSERKNNLPLKFKLPRVDTLVALSSKITPCKKNNFIYRYGKILDLLTTSVDVSALVALSQYYDPPLRCFTFKDFQLALTIEEYEKLLDWYVKDHHPFIKLDELLMPESLLKHSTCLSKRYPLVSELGDFLGSSWKTMHVPWKKRGNGYPSLKQTEKERGDNHRWFELAIKEKKALRDESDLEIQDLKLSLREANAKVEVECRLKEEAIRVSYITPQLKEKAHMNSLLDTYVGSINLLQPAASLYRAKYDCLVRFCNKLTHEVPWKLEDSVEYADEKATPQSIL
ncbi:hypothetical protein KIW84_050620 [Lathyrus oleraceus]|uniref:DUF7745 domain-containing protein n=1 Tax=Pisum sativum TaxID=3888 RepID=A0A9D4WM62_PEA|nr:hypothetical protein KIW84_050620 [Pisum sativum]